MSDQTQTPRPAKADRRRRLAIKLGIGLGVVVVLFVLVVFVLPTPLARYVIESQLESLGIQHDGIETVDIDLWNSQVRAGPVTFRSGEAQKGQIGETGFDYSFGALFKGRAFVQTYYLRGVDLFIARLDDGAIEINGVNLQELGGGAPEEAAQEPAPEDAEVAGFDVGVERFEFSDSQLVFEDLSGGTLTIDLDRLTLERLRTWTPEQPARFTLEGQLNEMEISLDGTVVPLGTPLRFKLNTRVNGITLDRVARFIGPTGLARQEGNLSADVRYDYAIHDDGRVKGTVDGTYNFADFEIATAQGGTVTLDKALLKVDLEQELMPDGSASAAGQFDLTAGSLSVTAAVGDVVEIGGIELAFDDLNFMKGSQQRRRLLQADLSATDTDDTPGRAPTIVELMIGWARELAEDALNHQLSVDGQPKLTLNDGLVRIAARGNVPGQDIRFDTLTVDLGEVASQAFDAGVRAESPLEAVVTGLRMATADGRAQAELSELSIKSGAIDFLANTQETSLAFDLAVSLQQLAANDAQLGTLDLSGLSLGSESFTIKETPDAEEATGPVRLNLEGLTANLKGADGGMAVRGEALDLTLPSFSLTGKQGQAAGFSGNLVARGLSLERAGNSPLTGALATARTDLNSFRIAPLSAQAEITGGLATTFSEIHFQTGQDAGSVSLDLKSLETQVEDLRAIGLEGDAPQITLSNRTRLSGLSGRLPIGGGQTAEASIASLDAPLSELTFSDQALRATGDLKITGITAATKDESQSLDLARLSVSGLQGDSKTGVEAEDITFGKLVTKLTLPLPGTAEADGDGKPASVGAADEPEGGGRTGESPTPLDRTIKVGSLSLATGSQIDITDSSVEPPLQAKVVVEELMLGPIDTGAPETRTDVALALSMNDTSEASLHGWAAPFGAKRDFELTSNIASLPLPTLSPYAARMVGVNIESGALTAEAQADAANADLTGNIDLRIDDLFVTPLSEEEAEKLQADIGLPVGFAVSILKDSEGVISFGLPLSGTVESPQVDYSEAINKAITGAMASVFPTSWFGADGNTFEMQPARFRPGTTELTDKGESVADEIGELFAENPAISIRACGRAGRADLVALRGGPEEEAPDQAPAPAPAPDEAGEADGAAEPAAPQKLGPGEEITAPSDEEVEALLALATERGTAVRKYLEASHGIDPARIPECRTTYSIEDGKPPRAEFQF